MIFDFLTNCNFLKKGIDELKEKFNLLNETTSNHVPDVASTSNYGHVVLSDDYIFQDSVKGKVASHNALCEVYSKLISNIKYPWTLYYTGDISINGAIDIPSNYSRMLIVIRCHADSCTNIQSIEVNKYILLSGSNIMSVGDSKYRLFAYINVNTASNRLMMGPILYDGTSISTCTIEIYYV